MVWEGTTYSSTVGEMITPTLAKIGVQIHRKNISPLLEGGADGGAEIARAGIEPLSSCCGESQALHCLGETGSKLKLSLTKRKAHL
jgi:hypothetical protein